MSIKPLKIDDDGEIKRFQTGDKLSIEDQVEYNTILIRKLIFILTLNGINIPDKEILNELKYI